MMYRNETSFSAVYKFWYAWLPLSIVGFAVIYLAFYLLYQFQSQRFDEQVQSAFSMAKTHVKDDLETAVADLRFIADNPVTQNFVAHRSDYHKEQIEKLFLSMSKSHQRYDQMRLLSTEGKELLRINYNRGKPIVVQNDRLQDKSGRYYFTESLHLASGDVFISRFDLNIENGGIEYPIKPTIRFSSPIFDQEGKLAAIVVLNHFGSELLEHVKRSFAGVSGEAMLLNSDGYWLLNTTGRKDWGFMYGHKQNFSSTYPDSWNRMINSPNGVIKNESGRLYFTSVKPPTDSVLSDSPYSLKPWKLVVLDEGNGIGVDFFKKHLSYLYPLLIAYPLGSVLLWYWAKAAAARNRAEEELKRVNASLESKVKKRTDELAATRQATILSLATLAETRDNETGQHIRRTQKYAKVLAEQLLRQGDYSDSLTEDVVEEIYQSAPLHDIGKVGIPDRILHKTGPLSEEEFEVMKTHTTLGSNAIEEAIITIGDGHHQNGAMKFLHCARDIAHYHHEKWDGSGYPKGLCGEAIPITARIMALVDVYDALVSERVYKEAFSRDKAERIILKESEGQFDPKILEAFKSVKDEFWQIRRDFADPSSH